MAERDAALAYWTGWRDVEISFRKSDADLVPPYWCSFGKRISPLTTGPRLAANPFNAILNYLYSILEAETRIALPSGSIPYLGSSMPTTEEETHSRSTYWRPYGLRSMPTSFSYSNVERSAPAISLKQKGAFVAYFAHSPMIWREPRSCGRSSLRRFAST